MNNTSRSNQIDCAWIYETCPLLANSEQLTENGRISTRWEDMEIVLDISNYDRMTCIISSLIINLWDGCMVPDIWRQCQHLGKGHQQVFLSPRPPTALRLLND